MYVIWGQYVPQVLSRHILSLMHKSSSSTIHVGTLGTYYRPKAYIVTGDNIYRCQPYFSQAKGATIYAVNFDVNCHLRQIMPLTLKQDVPKTLEIAIILK